MTGAGKSRPTATALAKVPSEKRSTHEASGAKSASKHNAKDKPRDDADNPWDVTGDWGNIDVKNESKHSGSKKASSKKEAWDTCNCDTGDSKKDPWNTADWGADDLKNETSGAADEWPAGVVGNWDTAAAGDEKDNKKDVTTENLPATGFAVKTAPQETLATAVVEGNKAGNSSSWTKEQDERLMHIKAQNPIIQWKKIAEELGKDHQDCKSHFNLIKPKDWKPNNVKQAVAGGGNGGGGKKGNEGKNGNNNNKSDNNTNVNGVKASADTCEDDGVQLSDLWPSFDQNVNESSSKKDASGSSQANKNPSGGANAWDTTGDAPGRADTSGEKNAWDNDNTWGNEKLTGTSGENATTDDPWLTTSGGNVADTWGLSNGRIAASTPPDDNDDQNNDTTGGADVMASSWDPFTIQNNNTGGGIAAQPAAPPKSPSTRHSNKAPPQPGSQGKAETKTPESAKPASTRPATIELRPDDTFSADDLRLVARILQQDCAMVWNRVSWRFKDKTGRTVHADVFEKKITGEVEGKGSERGKRRK